jgi:hypothetical protein
LNDVSGRSRSGPLGQANEIGAGRDAGEETHPELVIGAGLVVQKSACEPLLGRGAGDSHVAGDRAAAPGGTEVGTKPVEVGKYRKMDNGKEGLFVPAQSRFPWIC